MQIKITTRYHFTPVRMAIIKKNTNNKFDEDTKKGNPHTLVAGVQIGTVMVENRIEVSQKLKTELPYDPANLWLPRYGSKFSPSHGWIKKMW